jgi:hypothetical protein
MVTTKQRQRDSNDSDSDDSVTTSNHHVQFRIPDLGSKSEVQMPVELKLNGRLHSAPYTVRLKK